MCIIPVIVILIAVQIAWVVTTDEATAVSAILFDCTKIAKWKTNTERRPHCEDQLIVNIRMNPSFQIEETDKFLLLDEVFNPQTHKRVPIISPYLIQVTRGEPIMMYPLQFSQSFKTDSADKGSKTTTPVVATEQTTVSSLDPHLTPNSKIETEEQLPLRKQAQPTQKNNGKQQQQQQTNQPLRRSGQKPLSTFVKNMVRKPSVSQRNSDKMGTAHTKTVAPSSPDARNAERQVDIRPQLLNLVPDPNSWNDQDVFAKANVNLRRPVRRRNFMFHNKGPRKREPLKKNGYADEAKYYEHHFRGNGYKDLKNRLIVDDDVQNYGLSKTMDKIDNYMLERAYNKQNARKQSQPQESRGQHFPQYARGRQKQYKAKDASLTDIDNRILANQRLNHVARLSKDRLRMRSEFRRRQMEQQHQFVKDMQRQDYRNQDNAVFNDYPDEAASGSQRSGFRCRSNLYRDDHQLLPFYIRHPSKKLISHIKSDCNRCGENENLLSQEPPQFLPRKPPFKQSIDDPNLTFNDKMKVLDTVDTRDCEQEGQQKQYMKELEAASPRLSHIFPMNVNCGHKGMPGNSEPRNEISAETTKQKRSFLVYDDLEMRETFDEDSLAETKQSIGRNSMPMMGDEDVQPCGSCGGKGKKPPNKNDALVQLKGSRCSCRTEVDADDCKCEGNALERTPACKCNSPGSVQGAGKSAIANVVAKTPQSIGPNSMSMMGDEDVQPCGSCGGKGKKPPNKNDALVQLKGSRCSCRVEEDADDCKCEGSALQRTEACKCHHHGLVKKDRKTEMLSNNKERRSILKKWYAVFNMSAPLPFLTTKVRIYRKRHDTWWRIAPVITLNSLSGVFANANLSILFSSHVEVIQLEKALRLRNHQLIVPHGDMPSHKTSGSKSNNPSQSQLSNDPSQRRIRNEGELLANKQRIDPNTAFILNSNISLNDLADDDVKKLFSRSVSNQPDMPGPNPGMGKTLAQINNENQSLLNSVYSVADLGFFPPSTNILQSCPNDKDHLCLNLLDDKVPAFSIKIKLPFLENAIRNIDATAVKISNVITDATMKDVMQVRVDVINEGLEAREYEISITNCDMSCAMLSQAKVQKVLLPRLGESLSFLLPLILEAEAHTTKIYHCDVIVKSIATFNDTEDDDRTKRHDMTQEADSGSVVATRQLDVAKDSRCLCIWGCNCHCTGKLETNVDFNVCKKMAANEAEQSGFKFHCQPGLDDEGCRAITVVPDVESDSSSAAEIFKNESQETHDNMHRIAVVFFVLLLLGLLKASMGLMVSSVNRLGYSIVQLDKCYEDASRTRRYIINTFFFIIFPFSCWCKCFSASQVDLLVASQEWQCSRDHGNFRRSDYDSQDDDEEGRLHCDGCNHSQNRSRLTGGEDPFELELDARDYELAAYNQALLDDEDDDDEMSTKYVLQALIESRETLKKLLRGHSSEKIIPNIEEVDAERFRAADAFVQSLKQAQIVYRLFDRPVGNVRGIPPGIQYCVQGYFLPSLGREYEFVNYNPLAQYFCVSEDGTMLRALRPPVMLCPKEFGRMYENKLAVFDASDLFVQPPVDAPCINISTIAAVATSVARLATDSYGRDSSTSSRYASQSDRIPEHLMPEDIPLPESSKSSNGVG